VTNSDLIGRLLQLRQLSYRPRWGKPRSRRRRRPRGVTATITKRVYARAQNGNGYKMALAGFDFLPDQLSEVRQRFKAYLQRYGVEATVAEQEANGLEHSWEFAAYGLIGKSFLHSLSPWRGALDLTPGNVGLQLFDKYQELRKHDAYEPHDDDPGVMIAVQVPSQVASQLAVPGGNKPEDLHCTLAYLGRLSEVQDLLNRVREVLRATAEYSAPMTGKVNGLGRFGASESSDGKEVVYATLDCPGLVALRQDLVGMLEAADVEVAKDHDFAPHITLSYVEPGEEKDISLPDYEVAVGSISLVFGDTHEQFDLGAKAYHLPGQHDQETHGNRGGNLADKAIEKGGFTYNPIRYKGRMPPRQGFALALHKNTEKVIALSTDRGKVRDQVKAYVKQHWSDIKAQGNFLGGWTEGGKLYLDISNVVSDQKEAVAKARQAHQLAIYDLGKGETVHLRAAHA
jgi:2'-5' RNA ligase